MSALRLADPACGIAAVAQSALAPWAELAPWALTAAAADIVQALLAALPADAYRADAGIAVHRDAQVEAGAQLKPPLIIGPRCRVAAGTLLRGGCWLEQDCVIGPGSELKSSLVFAGSRLAHFNFVGDSVLGHDVNLEAGSVICNHRNERPDHALRVRLQGRLHRLAQDKFGALVGDGARIGANAVIAPGALLAAGCVVARAALHDDELAAAPRHGFSPVQRGAAGRRRGVSR